MRKVDDGYVIFRELDPRWPEQKVGNIVIPSKVTEGRAFIARDPNTGREAVVSSDKSVLYGRVIGCGLKADRTTCRPFPQELQGDYPLPNGTWVKARRANDWKVGPNEQAINTWDIIEHTLPGSPTPEWAPEE